MGERHGDRRGPLALERRPPRALPWLASAAAPGGKERERDRKGREARGRRGREGGRTRRRRAAGATVPRSRPFPRREEEAGRESEETERTG